MAQPPLEELMRRLISLITLAVLLGAVVAPPRASADTKLATLKVKGMVCSA